MIHTYIIGRNGNQPFKITSESVHGEHARITITEQGGWILEDLKGGNSNGTYIQGEDGEFHKVYRVNITPDTVIRLANGGHRSYTFMAHRVLAVENDFSYEFKILRKMYKKQLAQEKKQEALNVRNGWIAKCSTLVPYLFCPVVETCMEVKIDVNIRYALIMVSPIIAGLFFRNDNAKLKKIKERRLKIFVCPKCGRPLSEFDINNMQCSICKAE